MTKIAMNELLKQLEGTVQLMADNMNTAEITVEGVRVLKDEKRAAKGPLIFADKMASALHESIHGRTTIVYNSDRKPKMVTVVAADGTETQKVETSTKPGALVYKDNALKAMNDAEAKDPDYQNPWTERWAQIASEQIEFCGQLDRLLGYFVNLYIEAAGGTETEWRPYIERRVAELNSPTAQLEASPEAEARRAKLKAQIEKIRKTG